MSRQPVEHREAGGCDLEVEWGVVVGVEEEVEEKESGGTREGEGGKWKNSSPHLIAHGAYPSFRCRGYSGTESLFLAITSRISIFCVFYP